MKRAVVAALLAFVALGLPARAAAHATLIAISPSNGAVLVRAPQAVRVEFDDTIHVAPGNAAVSNETNTSVLGGAATVHGHVLTVPLRTGLRNGDYSVRWSIVSDDGHREQGVIAFAVGTGRAAPHSVLGAAAPLSWNDVLLRTLYYFGLLAGAGAAIFGLLTRNLLGEALRKPLAHLLFFSLLLVFLGGSGMVHSAPAGTRFALVLKFALTVALAGGAAAALAPTVRPLLPVAGTASLLLLFAPTLSGHALDRSQRRFLSVPADFIHLTAAAVWLGGLLSLVYVVPRATTDGPTRVAVARRFSTVALVAVLAIGVTGITRSLTELSAVHQVWSTSYGRALVAKTVLFVPLIGLGWLNRTLLLGVFARLRRSVFVEITVIVGIVIAVAILTELRPGRDTSRAASAPATPQVAQPIVLPARDAVVDARELGSLGVAIARVPGEATVTVFGPDGTGVSGLRVLLAGARTTACGAGCYRAPAPAGDLRVTVGSRTLTFSVPARAPDAQALLRQVTKRYRNAKTIVFDESLASSPTNEQRTRFTVVAPDRLSYKVHGGPAAIVIAARRWDRDRVGAPWVLSQQSPLDVTQPYWQSPTNVHLVAPGVLTFLDRRLPAWFRVTLAGRLPARMHMTAPAHFMTDRYVEFGGPVKVSPPPSR
ncbi:MAG TPA: copper resistance protein CopC [Gaiellaceae bacterium]|nr:copper resistance protein CopC [Gaiellaceae bacterium]